MKGAPYTNPMSPPPVTGRSFTRIILTLGTVVVLGVGIAAGLLYWQGRAAATTPSPTAETPVRTWKSQSVYPPLAKEETVAQAVPPQLPPVAPVENGRLAAIERKQDAILAELERARMGPKSAVSRQAQTAQRRPPSMPTYVDTKLDVKSSTSTVPEYTLAPGATKLPCIIETAINSDVEGYFTAKVSINVYDTATGQHLLVPQGSTILAHDQSRQLVYGNERLDTVSLKLTLPDGRSVDLGRAPVTDEQGIAGLTGEVDQHYGRLLAAVLIQGALKGGATVVATAASEAAGAGPVASGIAGVGAQTGARITGPLLDTRPTIKVSAGQLCNILLIEPLHLSAMWQHGEPREAVKPATISSPILKR
jgi:type IV secretory pathway VirB10-like protein